MTFINFCALYTDRIVFYISTVIIVLHLHDISKLLHWPFNLPTIFAVTVYDASGVFLRERSSGVWRLSTFYLAVMTSEIPATVVMITAYSTIIYWMAGLTATPGNYFAFLGIMMLSAFTAQVGLVCCSLLLKN